MALILFSLEAFSKIGLKLQICVDVFLIITKSILVYYLNIIQIKASTVASQEGIISIGVVKKKNLEIENSSLGIFEFYASPGEIFLG